MSKRVTIMIDDENFKKLRNLQAKMIKESNESVSFSRVINDIIRKGLTVS
jgi:predicted CopG family antitoxin